MQRDVILGMQGVVIERVRTDREVRDRNRKGTNSSGPKGWEQFGTEKVWMYHHGKGVNETSPEGWEYNVTERVQISGYRKSAYIMLLKGYKWLVVKAEPSWVENLLFMVGAMDYDPWVWIDGLERSVYKAT